MSIENKVRLAISFVIFLIILGLVISAFSSVPGFLFQELFSRFPMTKVLIILFILAILLPPIIGIIVKLFFYARKDKEVKPGEYRLEDIKD